MLSQKKLVKRCISFAVFSKNFKFFEKFQIFFPKFTYFFCLIFTKLKKGLKSAFFEVIVEKIPILEKN